MLGRRQRNLSMESLERRDMLSASGMEIDDCENASPEVVEVSSQSSSSSSGNRGGDESSDRIRLETRLTGDTAGSGKAKFEQRADRTRFSAEVEDLAPGAQIEVILLRQDGGSQSLGSLTTGADGRADLNLDSRDGDSVPIMETGDEIQVLVDGQPLLSGVLGVKGGGNGNRGNGDDNRGRNDNRGNDNNDQSEDRIRLETRLAGQTAASGNAKFEERDDRVKFSAEVEDVTPNTEVEAVLRRAADGSTVSLGFITTDSTGFADLNLDTRRGDTVPAMESGDEIEILVSGEVLLRGQLTSKDGGSNSTILTSSVDSDDEVPLLLTDEDV